MDPVVGVSIFEIVAFVAVVSGVFVPIAWWLRRRVGGLGLVSAWVVMTALLTFWSVANVEALRAGSSGVPTSVGELALFTSMHALILGCCALGLEFRFRRDGDPEHPLLVDVFAWGILGSVVGLLAFGVFFVFVGIEWLMTASGP